MFLLNMHDFIAIVVVLLNFLVFNACIPTSASSIVSGTAPWKYQYEKLQLPIGVEQNIQNGHGLTKDKEGNIYFTFQPINVSETTQALVKFSYGEKKMVATAIGSTELSSGVPHGLQYEYDSVSNKEYLYHANNQQTIFKTDLNGDIIWKSNFSSWKETKPEFWPFKPTDVVIIPDTNILLVADGYGSSFVHLINKLTGKYIEGRSFGGKGNTTEPIRFNTPHGIKVDKDNNFIVVSDRTNNRVVWLTFDFKYVRSKTLTEGLALPCNVCTIYHLILQFLYHLYETYVAIAATTRTTLSIYLYIYTYVHKQDKNLTCNTHVHMHYF